MVRIIVAAVFGVVLWLSYNGPAIADGQTLKGVVKEEQLRANMSSASVLQYSLGELFAQLRTNPSREIGIGVIPGRVDHFAIMRFGIPVLVEEYDSQGDVNRYGILAAVEGELVFEMVQGEQTLQEMIITQHHLAIQNRYYKKWLADKEK